MPFDLEATTHLFTKTDDGGVQIVTADDPADQIQIELIRAHLLDERANFARGDFDDPAQIHGHDMPGVAELTTGYADIDVTYAETPAGAQLSYTTDDPQLVAAIHAWFDRQLSDHGDDTPFVSTVGLFVDPDADEVRAALDAVPLSILQFHGHEPAALCRAFGRPYLKAIPVAPGTDLLESVSLYGDAAGILLDAPPADGLPGGTGRTFDWDRLRAPLPLPLVLSGG